MCRASGKATVIDWLCPGRSTRVRLFFMTKSWMVPPRFLTMKRTNEPAGTERRESWKE